MEKDFNILDNLSNSNCANIDNNDLLSNSDLQLTNSVLGENELRNYME